MTVKTKRLLITVAVGLVMLVFGAFYTVVIKPNSEKAYYTYEETDVYEGTLNVYVSESGSLEYDIKSITYDVDVNSVIEEDDDDDDDEDELTQRYLEIESVYLKTGERFSEGNELLKFTAESIESVRKLLQSALYDARQEYNDAEKEYNLSALEAKTTLEKQEVAKKYAAQIYNGESQSVSNDITSMEVKINRDTALIESLQEAIDEAYEDYSEALGEYTKIKEYYDSCVSEGSNYTQSYMNSYLNSKNAYERALETYEKAVEEKERNNDEIADLTSKMAIAKARQVIDKIDINEDYQEKLLYGDYAEILYEGAIEDLKEDLREAEEKRNAYSDKLKEFEDLVGNNGILYASEDGIITASDYEAGDELETTGVLFSYATADSLTITIDVTEEDVVYLSVGDEVDIEFNAYPGEAYKGIISSINTTATSTGTPTVSYEVVVLVNGSLEKLFGGMTANITFITKSSENTVYIDRKALVEENDSYYVYKKNGIGSKEKTPVTIGIKNESYVEILNGIDAKDTIYIPTLVYGKSDKKGSAE